MDFGLFILLNNEYKYLEYVSWSTCAYISAGCKPRSGMRMFDFNRYCQIASKVAVPIYTPTISVWQFSLLQICSKTWIVSHFNFSPPDGGVVTTHCDFNLYFSWLFMRFSSISYVYWSVDLRFKVITVHAFCPFPQCCLCSSHWFIGVINMSSWSKVCVANTFFFSVADIFTLLRVSCDVQNRNCSS